MPEIRDQHLRSIMDSLVATQDQVHKLMCDMAEVCGFYRKRVVDVTPGDEIAPSEGYWGLVVDVEQTATHEGDGVVLIHIEDGREFLFGFDEIVDVRAVAPQEAF